jgi:hypothetical protein
LKFVTYVLVKVVGGAVAIIHRYPLTLHLGEVVDELITVYYACQTCGGTGEVEDEAPHA